MTTTTRQARSELGRSSHETLLARECPTPQTLFESSWRDYIFAEVWNRPGLDLRARHLIAICGAASADTPSDILDGYLTGALQQSLLTPAELREAALHFAVYGGWSRAAVLDRAITRVLQNLELTEEPFPPLGEATWEPEDRLSTGAKEFHHVMTFAGPPPATAYFQGGILNFVFGEMWHRPGLDQRSRRWVTLVGVADSSADSPIRTHIYGAMASGNASYQEMDEFVLQYAIHSGWPRASFVQGVVIEMAQKIKQGLTWDGKPKEDNNDE